MDPQLVAQLRQIVSYASSTATANVYGEVQIGSTATIYARIEPRVRIADRNDGSFLRSSHMLILAPANGFTPDYGMRFWILGDSPNSATFARAVKSVHPCFDEDGALDHWEVLI